MAAARGAQARRLAAQVYGWRNQGVISYCQARKIAVSIVGGTVLAAGVALIVLPGPAVVVIPVGLAILALEFAWARRWLKRLREAAGFSQSQPPAAAPAPEHARDDFLLPS